MKRTIYEVIIKHYDNEDKREVKIQQYENEIEDTEVMQGADFDAVDHSYVGYSSVSQSEALKELFSFLSAQAQKIVELYQLPIFKNLDWSDSDNAVGIEYTAQINLETDEFTLTDEVVHPLRVFKEYEGTFQYEIMDDIVFAISYESAERAEQHLLNGLNELHNKIALAALSLGQKIRAETSQRN